ncbi:TIGR00282 family metallophosphoesterase [candidate division KSB1 bacterium]|nr:MAG: TIGR00282 family metallophosphoesterase [candidate division KSB1 bacterium]
MPNKKNILRVLFIADIVGKGGIDITSKFIVELFKKYDIELCIANAENAYLGKGITSSILNRIFRMGINVVTSGNHIWDKPGISSILEKNIYLLRPINYPKGNPGRGSIVYRVDNRTRVGIINAQGRTFMYPIDCPFRTVMDEVVKIRKETNLIIIDFHAEATSEKLALAYYLDGKVSAVIGTHTHIQTADERILPDGTAYITDVGMTGSYDSILGIKKEIAINRFLYQIPIRYEISNDNLKFNGILLGIDKNTGKAIEIKRLKLP